MNRIIYDFMTINLILEWIMNVNYNIIYICTHVEIHTVQKYAMFFFLW